MLKALTVAAMMLLATPNIVHGEPLTVVELFTSQGCSSCPPANDNLAIIAKQPDVLALSFGVTYWDYLGWRDTFASPQNTNRQTDYARALRLPNVYTPQMVINGRVDTVGGRLSEISRLSRSVPIGNTGPTIATTPTSITLSASSQVTPASIWLVRYDPRVIQVPVQRGENTGKTLPHTNVVRELVRLGTYQGQQVSLRLPPQSSAILKSAILVQRGNGGAIIAARKL
jgi:hypothetical protein